jgi:Na+:H+ antiporter, NhaA family
LAPNHPKSEPALLSEPPPGAWEPLTRLARLAKRPLDRFLQIEAASGILLLVVAAVALLWANSPWASSYFAFWHSTLGLRVGNVVFEQSLEWVVNDGLMVVFFFVVGLEIRRELHHGELSDWRRAALPFAAAFGGMVAPALLYLSIAGQGPTHSGWGVPMATDIAFAVGVLTLLGKRAPPALRVLLLALAVIDDLGAILVIALFYSSGVVVSGLVLAAAGVAGILAMQAFGVRRKTAYILPALVVWAGIHASGIHPTIAGVVVGMLTPVKVWLGPEGFLLQVRSSIDALSKRLLGSIPAHELNHTLHCIERAQREAMSPAASLIATLHPWVAFVVMPIFALANAGVALGGFAFDATTTRLVVGVGVGLVLGKLLGVLLACQLALRLKLAIAPIGITLRHLVVLGAVAGIGFTMALFVAQLAFADVHLLGAAKLGVLMASGMAALVGLGIGWLLLKPAQPTGIARTADEAEDSSDPTRRGRRIRIRRASSRSISRCRHRK